MAERAHPDHEAFKLRRGWKLYFRKGVIPWLRRKKNPYADAAIWRFRWVAGYVKGRDVLDVPCGMGWGTSFYGKAKSVVGIDISEEAIDEAKQRYSTVGRFGVGSMEKLNFENSSFDVVSCLEGIEHVPIEIGRSFLDEASRVLRPGGVLLMSSPYCLTKEHSGNPYHIHEYQPSEIKEGISRNFEIQEIVERDVDIMRILYIVATKR